MADWEPDRYLKFAGERSRPAMDLLAHVECPAASVIYDLGCGPGNSTALLVHRFPRASITGIDNSPAMLAEARRATPDAAYSDGDLENWLPPRKADLLFANAALQWVPNHVAVMQRLIGSLKPLGMLAVQMPDNLEEPSHALMRKAAQDVRWQERLRAASTARQPLLTAASYVEALGPLCRKLEVWRTTYHHRLANCDAIVEFVSSTGLRPFLDPLTASEQKSFKQEYGRLLSSAYPPSYDGTVLLAFPRLFILAQA